MLGTFAINIVEKNQKDGKPEGNPKSKFYHAATFAGLN